MREEGEWRQELLPAAGATLPLSIPSSRVVSFCDYNCNLTSRIILNSSNVTKPDIKSGQWAKDQVAVKGGRNGTAVSLIIFIIR